MLLRAYRACGSSARGWTEEIRTLPRGALSDTKLFLYYLQRGRCLYTGEKISAERLASGEYDIDHICPKSLTHDSSIGNLALVRRDMNRAKSDTYPLPRALQREMEPFWHELLSQGLMTKDKYRRLTRRTPLTEKEIAACRARQMALIRQNESNRRRNLRQNYFRTFRAWSRRIFGTGLFLAALYAAFRFGEYLRQL